MLNKATEVFFKVIGYTSHVHLSVLFAALGIEKYYASDETPTPTTTPLPATTVGTQPTYFFTPSTTSTTTTTPETKNGRMLFAKGALSGYSWYSFIGQQAVNAIGNCKKAYDEKNALHFLHAGGNVTGGLGALAAQLGSTATPSLFAVAFVLNIGFNALTLINNNNTENKLPLLIKIATSTINLVSVLTGLSASEIEKTIQAATLFTGAGSVLLETAVNAACDINKCCTKRQDYEQIGEGDRAQRCWSLFGKISTHTENLESSSSGPSSMESGEEFENTDAKVN